MSLTPQQGIHSVCVTAPCERLGLLVAQKSESCYLWRHGPSLCPSSVASVRLTSIIQLIDWSGKKTQTEVDTFDWWVMTLKLTNSSRCVCWWPKIIHRSVSIESRSPKGSGVTMSDTGPVQRAQWTEPLCQCHLLLKDIEIINCACQALCALLVRTLRKI